nr:hypothetical protein [Tanacetum cinerariifolium]
MNTLFTKQSILGKSPSSSFKPKLYYVTPFLKSSVLPKVDKTNALSKPVTSNSAPATRESKVMQTVNVIAPRIFRTNPSKTSRVDNVVLNKPVETSVRIKPITVLQPNVIHKQQANSDSHGFTSTKVNNIAKTRRPHPRSNFSTDRVPSKSKSSCLSNKVEKIDENHRNSQILKNQKHMSSKCNNITLAIRNAKYEIVCVMCKQCLVTANHDVCVLNYVNDMNSLADNQSANVSIHKNQKKHKANAKKSKELGFKGSLASSRPSEPRTCLRWIPTGRIFAMCVKLTTSSNAENKLKKSVSDNESTSNPSKPSSKGFFSSASLLGRGSNTLSWKPCQGGSSKLNLPDHRVESSDDEPSLGKDASKHRRISDIDADEGITQVSTYNDAKIFDADKDLHGEEVFVAKQDENVVEKEVDAAQGKAIMIEEPMKLKKKDQIMLDEEVALKLQAELQAEIDKEQRLASEKAQQEEEEAKITLIETWDDV